jgi:hypothetical protein
MYPPVLNFLRDLISEKPYYFTSVFTTRIISVFKKKEFECGSIWRFGIISDNRVIRYLSYLYFNLFTTIFLIRIRPDSIIIYETLSVFPAYVYKKIFKSTKIHIHYHEYSSLHEKNNASNYIKFLFKIENSLLRYTTSSHTNEDRKLFFLVDNPKLDPSAVEVYPNLPPSSWWNKYGKFKKLYKDGRISLVYLGALDFETMFLDEILTLVMKNADILDLTFFCHNLTDKVKLRINEYNAPNIFLKEPIVYDNLPEELVKYDVGLVLYKGLIPNHVYSVPNKVNEYLSCGLHVVVHNKLITTARLNIEQIGIIDFTKLDVDFLRNLLLNLQIKMPDYSCKSKLIDKL